MSIHIERSVYVSNDNGNPSGPTPIGQFQNTRAWVLLGDPGSGKSTTFETLAQQEGGTCITVRDFLDGLRPNNLQPPLFIDGLDEATAVGGQSSFGLLRSKLLELGTPTFRLSCREADWRGTVDSDALKKLVVEKWSENAFAELHLAPLNAQEVLQFAAHWLDSTDKVAQAFVKEAERRDLDGLLTNPQTLRMLIEAVGKQSDDWPQSKTETYGKACAKLVREQNAEHVAAQRDQACADKQLLHSAGYLCGVMLLSGCRALALNRQGDSDSQAAPQVLVLTDLTDLGRDGKDSDSAPSLSTCQAVLKKPLFVGDGKGNFRPVHRTVAEYLGAEYLAERIRSHLSPKRVLALIQGEDGGVVPELRGLHAWLAVVADESVRSILIAHDPLGLVLHGDVLNFRPTEKVKLLQALQQEAERSSHFRQQNWAGRPFGALATLDMQAHFKEWLQSPDRSDTHQAVLDCVLDAMEHGQPMPALADELERIVGDTSYWPALRRTALLTLCKIAASSQDWTAALRILDELNQGKIQDLDHDLQGALLRQLYPTVIQAKDLWAYYKPIARLNLNQYWRFWDSLAKRYAPREDIPVLMDGLLAAGIRLDPRAYQDDLSKMIGTLLHEAIVHFAKQTPIERVYQWLNLGQDSHFKNKIDPNGHGALGQWFSEHPVMFRQLMAHSIKMIEKSDRSVVIWLHDIDNILCQAQVPAGCEDWYFELAEPRTDDFRWHLIHRGFTVIKERQGANAALERLSEWTHQHPEDAEGINSVFLTCTYPPSAENSEFNVRKSRLEKETAQKNAKDHAFLSTALPQLTSDRASLSLLERIGAAYMQVNQKYPPPPRERLLATLNNNPHWVDMALAGLRHGLRVRDDLPSLPDIFATHRNGQVYTIATPLLAAMALRFDETPTTALDLDDDLLQSLVAFQLTHRFGLTPNWFAALLQTQPDLVAGVMLPHIRQQFADKVEQIEGLYSLARDPDYALVAQRLAPELVNAVPVKTSKNQLRNLQVLIACLLQTTDQTQQLALIEQQLAKPGMDVAQHVYWLTAGAQVAPATYLAPLQRYVQGKQMRIEHACDLLRAQSLEKTGVAHFTLEAKAFWIELLGERFTPALKRPRNGTYTLSPAMENTEFVQRLIHEIAADSSDAACQALTHLAQKPQLQTWIEPLKKGIFEQQILRRKALFKHASVSEVCQTMANQQPANAADLCALVVDCLSQLAHEIRHGNTDDYLQYWVGDKPKPENNCRDCLLSDLKKSLHPLGLAAEPEGNYAEKKRADIKVIHGALHMPIEIKCETNRELWTGIRNQLIDKYSRERSSDGYGVYIVFWFGLHKLPPAGDGGKKPKTAKELQDRLSATLPQDLKNKITVLVIDCVKPIASALKP